MQAESGQGKHVEVSRKPSPWIVIKIGRGTRKKGSGKEMRGRPAGERRNKGWSIKLVRGGLTLEQGETVIGHMAGV